GSRRLLRSRRLRVRPRLRSGRLRPAGARPRFLDGRARSGRDLTRRLARILEARLALRRAEVVGDPAEDADGARPERVELLAADWILDHLVHGYARSPMPKKFLIRPRSACRSPCMRAAASLDSASRSPLSSCSRSCNR